jgi:putative DNA primase/helicase
MRFEDFARMHGLIFNSIIPYKWVSTPTVDHPRSGNGRYKYMGDVGFVQNWATMEKPAVWKPDENYRPTAELTRAKNQAVAEREELATKAASKAGWILHQCTMKPHPYLEKKGFPDEEGNVWEADGGSKLVIPMRMNNRLVGCQLIDEEGNKKFLYGQRTKGASFSFADKLDNVFLCEGYATGLSIRHIMKANSMRYTIHVCFSAGNMKEVARSVSNGIIIADNDPSHIGETIAKETGKPYWLSDTVGEDFNDYHMRVGLFKASQALKKLLVQQKSGAVYSSNK